MFCVSCAPHAFASVYCCLVFTCWARVDLLAPVGDVYCIFVTFPCGILGQVWYSIVSFPDLCRLSYFEWLFLPISDLNICFLASLFIKKQNTRFYTMHNKFSNCFV